jgi:hypothetical protein
MADRADKAGIDAAFMLFLRSSDILSYQIDMDILLHNIDIIENNIICKIPILTAKL